MLLWHAGHGEVGVIYLGWRRPDWPVRGWRLHYYFKRDAGRLILCSRPVFVFCHTPSYSTAKPKVQMVSEGLIWERANRGRNMGGQGNTGK